MRSGVRIVGIAGHGPGPLCAMHLADLGADVISTERIDRPSTARPPRGPHRSRQRSMLLDLKQPEGREVLSRLLEGADALIEGMRPGVMERLGLRPDVCRVRNQQR